MKIVAGQSAPTTQEGEVRAKFQEFVAGTFYRQLLKELRRSQGENAYFHGGQAEKIFQEQFDQIVSQNLAKERGGQFADSLYDRFALDVSI